MMRRPPRSTLHSFLHDALPICRRDGRAFRPEPEHGAARRRRAAPARDRKSTRLNSSHVEISYAVFCLKKKKAEWKMAAVAYVRLDDLRRTDLQRAVQDDEPSGA